MGPGERWSRGDVVALREIWKGRVWKARPWIVVHDRPEEVALYIPLGSPTKVPRGGGVPRDSWELDDGTFNHHAVRLAPAGRSYSILLFWAPEGEFDGWYVNLERDFRRDGVGFVYEDQLLDVWVNPDGSWHWLDEDELEEGVERGIFSPAEAAEIRAEGERVIAEWPFPTGWEEWKPDPSWGRPELPKGWETVQGAQ